MTHKILLAIFAAMALSACDVEKTEEGDLPNVDADAGQLPEYEVQQTQEGELPDVDVEGGNLPEYDVDAPDVDVGTTKKEVTVPTVDIDPAEDDDDQ